MHYETSRRFVDSSILLEVDLPHVAALVVDLVLVDGVLGVDPEHVLHLVVRHPHQRPVVRGHRVVEHRLLVQQADAAQLVTVQQQRVVLGGEGLEGGGSSIQTTYINIHNIQRRRLLAPYRKCQLIY